MNIISENNPLEIGRFLRAQRKRRGLNQQDLARRTGVRRQTIADLENGKNAGSHLLYAVMKELGVRFTLEPDAAPEREARRPDSRRTSAPVRGVAHDFDFPYDWPNTGNMPDEILISKVVRGQRFTDIARLCRKYGIDEIEKHLESRSYDDIRTKLNNVMSNIRLALEDRRALCGRT